MWLKQTVECVLASVWREGWHVWALWLLDAVQDEFGSPDTWSRSGSEGFLLLSLSVVEMIVGDITHVWKCWVQQVCPRPIQALPERLHLVCFRLRLYSFCVCLCVCLSISQPGAAQPANGHFSGSQNWFYLLIFIFIFIYLFTGVFYRHLWQEWR